MRLVTDSNTSQYFVEVLRKLEWDVQTAYEAGLAGKVDDALLVRHGKKHNRIFLTFDKLRAEHGEKVARELRNNGGKVIQVKGSPGQNYYRALGKVLFHYPEWQPFLDTCDGVSVISDLRNCKNFTPREYHHTYHPTDAEQFEKYLTKRKQKTFRRRHRRTKTPPDSQTHMLKE